MLHSLTTRRNLLRLALGVPLGGVWSQRPLKASTSTLEKTHLGCIGVGNRGRDNIGHLSQIADQQIVALCDVDGRYLREMSRLHPHAKTHQDFREMLQERDLDAVVISTPDHTHAHIAVSALRRGLHVYCEKPLAHTVFETRLMAQEAKKRKRATQMGNQHHNSSGYRRAVEILRSGVLGEVRQAHVWTNRPLWTQGISRPTSQPPTPKYLNWDLWLGPAPQRPYHPIYHPFGWRGWWDFGAGALGDMGPHLIDPIYEGLNLGWPRFIEAESSPQNEQSAPAWSIVRYDFPARDGKPAFRLVWYDGGKRPPREITKAPQPPTNGVLVIGAHGKLFLPQRGRRPLLLPVEDGQKKRTLKPPPASKSSPYPGHYAEWLQACRSGAKCTCDFDYGARLSELCLLGNVALRAGKRIEWTLEKTASSDAGQLQPTQQSLDPAAAAKLMKPQYRARWRIADG